MRFLLFFLCFSLFLPHITEAKKSSISIKKMKKKKKSKKRGKKRTWSISGVSGYTFYNHYNKKGGSAEPYEWAYVDGAMHPYFSALEISRTQGWYDLGLRIQNTGALFVSPFFTWNFRKNRTPLRFLPSLTLGVVPSHILGAWVRFNLELGLSSHISLSPFISSLIWVKVGEDLDYEEEDIHAHVGLKLKLYY